MNGSRFSFENLSVETVIEALENARDDDEFAYIVGEGKAVWINPKNVVAVWSIPEYGDRIE